MWAGLLTLGLAGFVVLARPGRQEEPASLPVAAVATTVCAVLIVACVVLAVRMSGWQRAVLLAVGVGVLFGVVAVVTKMFMRVVAERVDPYGVVAPSLQMLRDLRSGDRDVKSVFGFHPLEVLSKLLIRDR